MADERILSESQAQLQGLDPFAVAKNKAEAQGKILSQSPVIGGNPFGEPQQPMMNENQAPQFSGPQSNATLQSLYQQPQQGQPMDQQLMNAIQKLDVDNRGLAVNPLGKMLFMQRLEKKYGSNYKQRSDIMKVMGAFDKAISFYGDEASKSMTETINKTNRTLAALRG